MSYERFDLIAGIYAYCVHNYGGQGCRLYKTMCLIERTCRPRNIPIEDIADGDEEWLGAHEVYKQLELSGY